jgi:cleavage stimulation factor subunit 3
MIIVGTKLILDTRALFERALQAVPEDKSHPIWKKYIDYETQYGDLTNLYGIESRFKKVADSLDVNSIESLEMIAAKYKYFDLDYIEKYELGVEQLRKRGRVSSKNVKGTSRIGAAVKDSATSVALLVGVNAEKFPKPDLTRWFRFY